MMRSAPMADGSTSRMCLGDAENLSAPEGQRILRSAYEKRARGSSVADHKAVRFAVPARGCREPVIRESMTGTALPNDRHRAARLSMIDRPTR